MAHCRDPSKERVISTLIQKDKRWYFTKGRKPMKKIITVIATLTILVLSVTNCFAAGDISIRAVRDPNNVKALPYEGSGKTAGTMSPALQAPSDGKITIYFKDCAFVGKATGKTHPSKTPDKVTVWVERYKSGTTWVTEKSKTEITLNDGAGSMNLTVTQNAVISVHFSVSNVPKGYTFKYTRGVKKR